ncbi:ferredoxin [Spongisporangium articulatum]|uniref:Ferredoxin n=1 Tax=Spongisporangium articulatum TaxID=3362603 RepID=A0ABW8AJJ1_9ACTN
MARQLSIDWTACQGRGLCADLLPELLSEDPWGYPLPHGGAGDRPPGVLGAVPDGLEQPARQAVRMCPRLALRLSSS